MENDLESSLHVYQQNKSGAFSDHHQFRKLIDKKR